MFEPRPLVVVGLFWLGFSPSGSECETTSEKEHGCGFWDWGGGEAEFVDAHAMVVTGIVDVSPAENDIFAYANALCNGLDQGLGVRVSVDRSGDAAVEGGGREI